ncbi:2,3-bisphosphoglycerate-independent phosphoglycerate mutase [Candidatus Woesearchaeota archaeon]|nr:2,3-bisphosphoglycerate-independent phosphoglycerate mutase [Candidatus Woesearchaeota archaeon]
MRKHKVLLIIRDGWGEGEAYPGNAIVVAKPKNHLAYLEEYPNAIVRVTGNDVGNPEGVQGGSEVGHLTMGAGRIVWQPYELINRAIRDGSFFENPVLKGAIEHCMTNGTDLHLAGLFSDQGVHADRLHLYAILELAKRMAFDRVFIHLILDGRDMPERSVSRLLDELEEKMAELGIGRVASVIGRYYGMDRDKQWDRTLSCYELWTLGKGHMARSAAEAIGQAYARGDRTDYYVQATAIVDGEGKPIALLKDDDGLIFSNFRSDRSRQIAAMVNRLHFCSEDCRPKNSVKVHYVCMCDYFRGDRYGLPVAFPQETVAHNLGSVVSGAGLRQLRIAETEKYAHVTFFFNSQEDMAYPGEDRILIDSPKVPSFDQKPEMSAYEITEKLLPEIGKYDLIVLNYANPDLVGHSGVFDAVVKACQVVDECVGRVVERALAEDYCILLMGDHGNADHMLYEDGTVDPSHGHNPVRLTLISDDEEIRKARLKKDGGLRDIAPTILAVMGIPLPSEMTGASLIQL